MIPGLQVSHQREGCCNSKQGRGGSIRQFLCFQGRFLSQRVSHPRVALLPYIMGVKIYIISYTGTGIFLQQHFVRHTFVCSFIILQISNIEEGAIEEGVVKVLHQVQYTADSSIFVSYNIIVSSGTRDAGDKQAMWRNTADRTMQQVRKLCCILTV